MDRLFTILIAEVVLVGAGVFTGFVQGLTKVAEKIVNDGEVALAERILPDAALMDGNASRGTREPAVVAAQRVEAVLKGILKNQKD